MPSTKFPWLKTFAATVISVSLLFTPLVQALTIGGGGSTPNNSPYIAWSTVTPGQFTPSNGELVYINWWLADAPGFVELNILDGHPNYGGQPIRELHGSSEYLFNGSPSHPFPWNGRNDSNQLVAPGTYYYLLKAYSSQNSPYGDEDYGQIVVLGGGNQGTPPTITSHDANPDPFDPDTQNTCFDVNVDKSATYATVEVRNQNNQLVFGLAQTESLSSGQNNDIICWSGYDLNLNKVANGIYTYKITAKNNYGTGNTVSGSVEVNTGVQGSAPTVLSHDADPNPFDSDNQTTCFDVKLDKSADYVTVEVKNGSTTVFGPTNSSSLGGGWNYNVKCWDGRDLNNNQLSDGFYTYKLTPKNNYGTGNTVSGSVEVNTGVQGSAPTVLSHDADPNPFDSDNQTTCFDVKLDKSADYVTVEVKDGSTTLYGPTNTGSLNSGWNYNVKCWDGNDLNNNQVSDGTYTYKLTPKNSYGTGSTVSGTVEVYTNGNQGNGPIIGDYKGNDSDDYADRNPFNPYDYSKTTIRFRLNEDANVTFTIRKGSTEIENITFSGQQGTNAVEWDGRKSNNDPHPKGTYTYQIDAWNIDGSDTETGTVVVDYDNGGSGDTPVITYHNATPDPFDPYDEDTQIYYSIDRNAYVTVEIYDDSNNNNTRIRTLLNDVWKLQGGRSVLWDGEDKYGDVVDDGYYEYKITACNQNDECDIEKGDVRVDRDGSSGSGDLLSNVRVTNATFDPTEGERAELCFEIEKDNTEILVQVMDGNRVIETLIDNAEYDSNYKRCVTWDGRDDDHDIVNDDVYQFRVRAEQGNDTEVEYAYTEVDTDGYIIGFPDDDEFCGGFWDVDRDSPFCRAVELMKYRGIFQGYSDGSFRPYADINRAETTKVILLALEFNIMSDDGSTLGFWDVVRRAWYMPYLRTGQRYGIVQGYPDGSFRPMNSVNRVELLKIFLEASELDIPYCNYSAYPDTPLNSDTRWYMDYACFAKTFNLMPTDGNGNFNPAEPMSRGDVAELFYRFEKRGLFDGYNSGYYGQYWSNYNYLKG